ncbi:MAG: sulfurtransferase [bacterium]
MTFSTLISTAELAQRLKDTTVVVIDCRFVLDDTAWGQGAYAEGHIPGAVYAHLNDDLAGPISGTNGRHPLPDPDTFVRTLGRFGIASGTQVVVYDQDVGMYASRLWWMLRWMGHDAVAVLDGGFAKWMAEGRPTATGIEQRPQAPFVGTPRPSALITASELATLSGDAGWRVLDARAPERFRGETEPLDRVAGHIPGAVNHFYKSNLEQDGTFRSPEVLRRLLGDVTHGVSADHVVCYCGSGVTACVNLLALEHAGVCGARLYAGSWSEWSSDPSRPIATGAL